MSATPVNPPGKARARNGVSTPEPGGGWGETEVNGPGPCRGPGHELATAARERKLEEGSR